MTEMAVDVLHTRPMTDLHLYIYVLWNLFNIQRFLFVTTETNLKVVVYDKTTGQKLKETDIDAEPFDITVVRPFSNDTVHGNCHHLLYTARIDSDWQKICLKQRRDY